MSTRLKCLLLDDELPGLTYLRMLCEQMPNVEVVKAYNNPEKLLNEAKDLDFDLCILDIEMPGLDGLQVAHLLSGKPVIFTTAYKEYATEAFDLDAIDYIQKPIKKDRLEKAIRKAAGILLTGKMERQFLQVNTAKGKSLLFFDQLLHITTSPVDKRDKLAMLDSGEEWLLKNVSFEYLLARLPAMQFCRINKKDILALRVIRSFTHEVVMAKVNPDKEGETTFYIGDAYRKVFMDTISR